MVDTPISGLPAAGSANDAMELEVNNAGTSEKLTRAQVLELPSATQREAFQSNLPKVVIASGRALAQATDYKRLVDIDNSVGDITLTLPDATGAQFTGFEPGHFCDFRVRSGANFASLTVAVTNTFRHQSGYGTATTGLEDTIFLGYRRNRGIGQVYSLYREDDRWLFKGDYRVTEIDDLTLDGPLHGGGGAIEVQDEGSQIVAAATAMDFRGSGVAVTDQGGNLARVTVTSGSGAWPAINIEDFAVGDGATDDTAGVQSALAAAQNGKLVLPVSGARYRLTSAVKVPLGTNGMIIEGWGEPAFEFESNTGGGLGVAATGMRQLELRGFRIEYTGGATGAIGPIGFATMDDLSQQGFGGDTSADIDRLYIEKMKFVRCKVMATQEPGNQVWIEKNHWSTPDATVKLNPYTLHVRYANGGESGVWIEDNDIRVHAEDDGTINGGGFLANTDIVKLTCDQGASLYKKIKVIGNHIQNLNQAVANAQFDIFFGGGEGYFEGNTLIDVIWHDKQDNTILVPAETYSKISYIGNFHEMTANISAEEHSCFFIRAGGARIIQGNHGYLHHGGGRSAMIRLDNGTVNSDHGFPGTDTNAPMGTIIQGNTCWLDGATTNMRFIHGDTGPRTDNRGPQILGNFVFPNESQSGNVVQCSGLTDMIITGNHSVPASTWASSATGRVGTAGDNVGITLVT